MICEQLLAAESSLTHYTRRVSAGHTPIKKEERKMTNKELAEEYNGLLKKHSIKRNPVLRFSSTELGKRRIAELKAEIAKSAPKKELPKKELLTKAAPPIAAPSLSATNKFRPAVEGQKMRYKMLKENPATTRKEYIAACVAIGIKASTAGKQWGFSLQELKQKFEEAES